MTLNELTGGIPGPNRAAKQAALQHWNQLAKPLGSLGALEEAITKMAALSGAARLSLSEASLLVFCADNGVVEEGVSQSDSTVTAAVARALGQETSTVNYLAKEAGCAVVPVNVGMREREKIPGVEWLPIAYGTENIAHGPAMTRESCEKAILLGAEMVRREKEKGTSILLLGEMGIGNTTTSAAVASVLLKKEAGEITGRGAGLSERGLQNKIRTIEKALAENHPDADDPIDILAKVGGFDLAALCGACLGGAFYRIPVLLDGMITCAAAACAEKLAPNVLTALLASHVSEEPSAKLLLEELKLRPFLSAGLRLGEGSGAVLALPLLRQTLALYQSGHTFEHLGIEAYQPQ